MFSLNCILRRGLRKSDWGERQQHENESNRYGIETIHTDRLFLFTFFSQFSRTCTIAACSAPPHRPASAPPGSSPRSPTAPAAGWGSPRRPSCAVPAGSSPPSAAAAARTWGCSPGSGWAGPVGQCRRAKGRPRPPAPRRVLRPTKREGVAPAARPRRGASGGSCPCLDSARSRPPPAAAGPMGGDECMDGSFALAWFKAKQIDIEIDTSIGDHPVIVINQVHTSSPSSPSTWTQYSRRWPRTGSSKQ